MNRAENAEPRHNAARFFRAIPSGGDLDALAAAVVHCRDPGVADFFTNCPAAMESNGKLLMVKAVRNLVRVRDEWAALVELGIYGEHKELWGGR